MGGEDAVRRADELRLRGNSFFKAEVRRGGSL